MDKELKAKWVAALRSGNYRQTNGVLKRVADDGHVVGFCCLGVLREVAGPDVFHEAEDEYLLDKNDARTVGITRNDQKTLSRMNDGYDMGEESVRKHSFDEIAAYIEANL